MPKFYIQIPHEAEPMACLKAIKVLQQTGSHFLTHAQYGCKDEDHNARIFVEVDNKHDALMIVPPAYRQNATVIEMTCFSPEEVERLMKYHSGEQSESR
jgi:hypothetical protein